MTKLKIGIIYGSYREKRRGIHVANFIVDRLKSLCEPVLIDAKQHNLPILDKMHKEFAEGEAPENMQNLSTLLHSCSGFVLVTGEYNHGFPAGLKNLLDHFQKEYYFKPAAIASYSAGSFGGVRAAVHARSVLGELGMPTISTVMPFPTITKTFDSNGNWEDEKMEKRFGKFAGELLWYAAALHKAREQGTPY